ncbi:MULTISPECIES: hypothetical protein [Nocardiaceae]|jgi:hypothetical protein|uniref:hypothetical protein n=1 Tax=Nocardiaceae TaxID=85025 RepID=UPI000561C996|nr:MULTISPECIES: hypothetical protein [Rhodococcus]OZE98241.1 hypothetical protein CH301_15815 [Rhodococcus sp. 15-1189-1-1a]OZF13222.1 hypothetical protein CH299_15595 [Rhodococcus sp. 14-2686-1-2]OZF50228.1 hypothetical protein CH293_16125 [Rhodococcus sp. 14-2470-1b]
MTTDRQTPSPEHRRPDGLSDDTVAAVGKVSEALETIERARGHLYSFHQLMGHADLQLGEAVDALREAGNASAADRLSEEMIGRNAIDGRWSFQIVEEFDDLYWSAFRQHEKQTRDELQEGKRHVFEAEMKESRRTHDKRGHEATP